MKKLLLTSLIALAGLALVACTDKTTKNTPSTTNNTTTETDTTTQPTVERQYTREGNSIYFGSYPQTLVEDTAKIADLNADTSNWTSYGYYVEGSISDYMFYKDVDTDNDGDYDYRGVYFTGYRPYLTTQEAYAISTYQDENHYEENQVYWFEYNPIKWNILREDNEDILVVSELLLDAQEIYHEAKNDKFDRADGKNGYANNYELSNIRKWLNDNFYNTAFNAIEKADIKTRTISNYTTPSKYASNETSDNVFLLSKDETKVTSYFANDEARKAKGTEYAMIQGLEVNTSIVNTGYSSWWTRTPSANSDYNSTIIYTDGSVDANGKNVNNTSLGVRPAILLYA